MNEKRENKRVRDEDLASGDKELERNRVPLYEYCICRLLARLSISVFE